MAKTAVAAIMSNLRAKEREFFLKENIHEPLHLISEAEVNVSEILQLIEITAVLMEHLSYSPDGIMEWWNIGMLV